MEWKKIFSFYLVFQLPLLVLMTVINLLVSSVGSQFACKYCPQNPAAMVSLNGISGFFFILLFLITISFGYISKNRFNLGHYEAFIAALLYPISTYIILPVSSFLSHTVPSLIVNYLTDLFVALAPAISMIPDVHFPPDLFHPYNWIPLFVLLFMVGWLAAKAATKKKDKKPRRR